MVLARVTLLRLPPDPFEPAGAAMTDLVDESDVLLSSCSYLGEQTKRVKLCQFM